MKEEIPVSPIEHKPGDAGGHLCSVFLAAKGLRSPFDISHHVEYIQALVKRLSWQMRFNSLCVEFLLRDHPHLVVCAPVM